MHRPEDRPAEAAPPRPRGPARRVPGPRPGGPPDDSAAAQTMPIEISSEALLAGRSEIHIRHRGEIYRLSLTRAGKLILHK